MNIKLKLIYLFPENIPQILPSGKSTRTSECIISFCVFLSSYYNLKFSFPVNFQTMLREGNFMFEVHTLAEKAQNQRKK